MKSQQCWKRLRQQCCTTSMRHDEEQWHSSGFRLAVSVPWLSRVLCGLSSLSHNHLFYPHTFEMQPIGAWNCNRSHSLPCGCPRLHPDFEVSLNEPHSAIKALPPRYSHCCHTGGTVSRFGGVEWSGEGKQAHTSVWMLHHNPKMWSSGICCFFQDAFTLKVYMLLTGKLKWYSANSGQISLNKYPICTSLRKKIWIYCM